MRVSKIEVFEGLSFCDCLRKLPVMAALLDGASCLRCDLSTTVAFFDGIERKQPWRLSDAVVSRQTKPIARRAPVRWQERDGRAGA